MGKVIDTVYKLVDLVIITMLVIMVSSIFINVIARYFGMAFSWVDEVSRLAFVWMSLMAIVVGQRKGLHPSFNMILNRSGGITTKCLLSIINIMVLIFLFYLLKGGIDYIARSYVQKTAILGISVAWKYLAVPLATTMMTVETLKAVVFIWKKDTLEKDILPGGQLR